MRIYLSVDMEGLAGVAHPNQVSFGEGNDRTDYDRSRALMAGEANAAIEAALERGATEVVVNDSHWHMRNLRAEDVDRERAAAHRRQGAQHDPGHRRVRTMGPSTAPPSSATTPVPATVAG